MYVNNKKRQKWDRNEKKILSKNNSKNRNGFCESL